MRALFFKPYQLPLSPCVRCTWARVVTFLTSGEISTCLLGAGLVGASVFALISPIPFSFLLFLSHISSVLCASDPKTFFLAFNEFGFSSLSVFCLSLFCVESFSGVFLGIAFSIVFLGPLRLYLLGLFSSDTTRR